MTLARTAVLTATVLIATLPLAATPPAAAQTMRDRQWYLQTLDVAAAHRLSTGDGLRRWRDMPRSRTHDLLFANAVAVFVLRTGNAAVRPVWRRSIGLTKAVLLITATWLAADAVTPAHLPTTASAVAAVFHGLGVRYVQTGAAAAWVGCIVLIGNALHVAGQMLLDSAATGRPAAIRHPGRRRPSRRRRGTPNSSTRRDEAAADAH